MIQQIQAQIERWLATVDPATLRWLAGVAIGFVVLPVAGLLWRRAARRREPRVETASPRAAAGEEVVVDEGSWTPTARLERMRAGLARSRSALGSRLGSILKRERFSADELEELEEALLASDVGVRSTEKLLAAVRALPAAEQNAAGARRAMQDQVRQLIADAAPVEDGLAAKPWVVLMVGVNGVGKTTTIGKLAARHRARGRSVLLVAGDTFRAAAVEQLTIWAERTGAQIVKQESGTDPSAVVYDGIRAAIARSVDVVLIDTAGRLHTKVNLMEELKKVHRIIARELPGAPHEVLLVVDATTGQNAVAQARQFQEAVAVTGVVLTKLDGSAKGGVVVAIRHELGLPVRYVGLGEKVSDLRPFDAGLFADSLFDGG